MLLDDILVIRIFSNMTFNILKLKFETHLKMGEIQPRGAVSFPEPIASLGRVHRQRWMRRQQRKPIRLGFH